MIRNAAGMLNSRIAVTATTNRTMTMLAARTSMTSGPTNNASSTVAIGPTTMSSTNSGRTTFPIVVKLPHDRATTLIAAIPAGRSCRGRVPGQTIGDDGGRALRDRVGAQTSRSQGAAERASERSPTYVSEPAEAATQAAAGSAPMSFVEAAHDRIEGGYDRHGVGDQVVLHQEPDELQVHE